SCSTSDATGETLRWISRRATIQPPSKRIDRPSTPIDQTMSTAPDRTPDCAGEIGAVRVLVAADGVIDGSGASGLVEAARASACGALELRTANVPMGAASINTSATTSTP